MNYTQWYAQNGKFQKHEQWLVDNLMLETIVGSHAYGCQVKESDFDVTALILPRYEHLYPQNFGFILGFDTLPDFRRKELKGDKNKVLIGSNKVEAEWVSLIEFFVNAGLKGSPNLIECLFVNKELVTVGTKMGWYLRDSRKLFISMKTFHSFKGYANGQMHRIRTRNPETDDRKDLISKHGYDCYTDETEFLTSSGWKRYEEIKQEKLATVKLNGDLEFQKPLSFIKKTGVFKIFEIENNFTKFRVTENHLILNSPCHRSKTIKYDEKQSNWNLTPIKILNEEKRRSWYHVRTSVNNLNPGLKKDLDELIFIGLYLAEGSICFRDNKIKSLNICQTINGKKEVFEFMHRVKDKFNLKEYTYKHVTTFGGAVEETVWVTHKKPLIYKIYEDFGKVKEKRFPEWVLNLSPEEADALRYGMFIGDGTAKKKYDQEIYYSTVKDLNDLYQILALLSGYDSNIMGPYKSKDLITYQTLVNIRKKSSPKALCLNTTGIKKTKNIKLRGGKFENYKGTVVCFEVPNGTLITRLDGKIAIQGNCKMAYHTLRLLDQLEQVLTIGDIDLMRNKEECKLMRAGQWGDFDRFDKEFQKRMDYVADLSRKCNLPTQPQEGALKKLLQEIIEEHYSADDKKQKEYISLDEVDKKYQMILDKLDQKGII